MTPFQHAREAAIAYRKALFLDRWDQAHSASTLIETALKDLDLDLALTSQDDPSLGSADALFDRSRGQILVRNDVKQCEQIFLVAHEIGHERLHVDDGAGCHRVVAMTLHPQDGETSGAMKVDAYGARERAELQANVFAREFLLPRVLAKNLFNNGDTADSISQFLGLPLELVRLQMLDALLLPEVGSRKNESKTPVVPTKEQQEAATSKAKVSLVVAGPGTGKTTTLTLRLRYLLDLGVKPDEILVLTFSNRTARDLVGRLAELVTENAHEIWVGTFHAFGLEFLRKHHDAFGLAANFGVADKLAQIALLEPELQSARLQVFNPFGDTLEWLPKVTDTIQRIKDELVTIEQYALHVEKDARTVDTGTLSSRQDIAALYRLYEEKKHSTGRLVDLGDLIMIPALALESDRSRFMSSIARFKHILVDEYQDVNRASARLIKGLLAGAETLWVVGDPRQAIYRFRGASMRNVVRFEADFPRCKKFDLTENRRSNEEIVRLLEYAGRAHPLQMSLPLNDVQAVRGMSGVRPVLVQCEDKDTMLTALAQMIDEHHEKGVRYGAQVVLGSSNKSCSEAADALNAKGIPALHLGDIFQREEIKDLMSLLQLLVDRSGSPLVRIARLPGYEVQAQDLSCLLGQLRKRQIQPLVWRSQLPAELSSQGKAALGKIADIFRGLSSSWSPWEVLCELLLGKHRLLQLYLGGSDISACTRRIAVWQFVHFTRVPDGVLPYQTVSGFLNRLRRRIRLGEDKELRNPPPEAEVLDAVAVMTIHGSKGLEFESVHLYDADESHFVNWDKPNPLIPQSLVDSTGDDAANLESETEGANRLYVALSRARTYLSIYENQSRWNARPVRSMSEATHLYEARQLRRADVTSKGVGERSTIASNESAGGALPGIELSDRQLLTYMVCPRRYYYDHVLGLTPRQSLPLSAEIENAIMSELSSPSSATSTAATLFESKGLLVRIEKEMPRAHEALAAYANRLLVQGRKWLGDVGAHRRDSFVVPAPFGHVRFQPHQVLKAGNTTTIRFFRVRSMGSRSRQMWLLRWLAGILVRQDQRVGTSTAVEFGVLSSGELASIQPVWSLPFPVKSAFDRLKSGCMAANREARDCVRCQHFAYCPA